MRAYKQLFKYAVFIAAIGASIAQADSPRTWGYWNIGPAAGGGADGGGFTFIPINNPLYQQNDGNTGNDVNNQQNMTRLNPRLEGQGSNTGSGQYVAYTPYGKLDVNISKGALTTAPLIPLKIDPGGIPPQYFQSILTANGTLDIGGATTPINLTENGVIAEGGFKKGDALYTNEYFIPSLDSAKPPTVALAFPRINATRNGENTFNFFASWIEGSIGGIGCVGCRYVPYALGKPAALADVARLASQNIIATFYGSTSSWGQVKMTVNFGPATWNADFARTERRGGFTADGSITGNTLTSTSVRGIGVGTITTPPTPAPVDGPPGASTTLPPMTTYTAGYVTGGKVNGTLVGIIKGIDTSNAGVIGHSSVDVQIGGFTSQTRKVNEAFALSVPDG